MTILVVSQAPPPVNGSTIMTQVFCESVAALGFETRLVSRDFSSKTSDIGNFKVRKIIKGIHTLSTFKKLLVDLGKPKVVIFLTNRMWSFVFDYFLIEICARKNLEVIAYVHTSGFERLASRNFILDKMVRRCMSHLVRVVCLSPIMGMDVQRFVESSRLVCIPNTVIEENILLDEDKRTVLFLSNLMPEKGPDSFISMSAALSKKHPSINFVVAGSSDNPSISGNLRQLNIDLGSPVEFVGFVDSEQKRNWLARAVVMVFPSKYEFEAQPLSVLESLAMGVPVVATDIGGLRDIVMNGVNGFTFAPGDEVAMELKVDQILSSESLARELSSGAVLSFQENYSPKSYISRWASLFEATGWQAKEPLGRFHER